MNQVPKQQQVQISGFSSQVNPENSQPESVNSLLGPRPSASLIHHPLDTLTAQSSNTQSQANSSTSSPVKSFSSQKLGVASGFPTLQKKPDSKVKTKAQPPI